MRGSLALIALSVTVPAAAQSVMLSPNPDTISLTVYADPDRGDQPINANWPSGYALITETRTVQIPAGESLIRFEGVAEGMFPESAIVTGLPNGVREKNRDARLLSPSGLVDAYLRRAVILTRTNRATGVVREQQAIITAGPNGGVVLQTADGYEALRCTGLPDRMRYAQLPANLSAKPTLSVITTADRAVTAKLTLTYMAAGFDWQANYVTQVSRDDAAGKDAIGKNKVSVFAWATLANGGNQSFINANTMVIAGRPNREARAMQAAPVGGPLVMQCWPEQRTHEVPYNQGYIDAPSPMEMMETISLTGAAVKRGAMMQSAPMPVNAAMKAEQEDLGDLKLYRIPQAVTVNAKGQKQVAMIVQPDSKFDRLYSADMNSNDPGNSDSQPMAILLRSENKANKGLGLPLPAGQVMIFEQSQFGPLLVGEANLADRAVGDKVELIVGNAADVRIRVTPVSVKAGNTQYKIEITNARDEAVTIEVKLPTNLRGKPQNVVKIDGVLRWKTTVAANGDAVLEYRVEP
jgi:hypothetical protein